MNRWLIAAGHVSDICRRHPYLQHGKAVRVSLLADLRSDIEHGKAIRDTLTAEEQTLLDRELNEAKQHFKNFELAEASVLFHPRRPDPRALN